MNGFGPQPYPVFMFLNVGSKYKEVMDFLSTETFLTEKAKAATFIPALSSANNSESIRSGRPAVQRAQYCRDPAEKYGEAVSPEQILLDGGAHLTNALRSILCEGKDVNTALRNAEEAVKKAIEADKNK